MSFTIRQAFSPDTPLLVPLFDAYRQFYGHQSDPALARDFLSARLVNCESIIFAAVNSSGGGIGFVQLYPSFTSVRCARIYIVNDLFVAEP